MPIREISTGPNSGYFIYGTKGKRYYYKTLKGRMNAKAKSIKQAIAIHASGYREKKS
jgi:hypothetical protein